MICCISCSEICLEVYFFSEFFWKIERPFFDFCHTYSSKFFCWIFSTYSHLHYVFFLFLDFSCETSCCCRLEYLVGSTTCYLELESYEIDICIDTSIANELFGYGMFDLYTSIHLHECECRRQRIIEKLKCPSSNIPNISDNRYSDIL